MSREIPTKCLSKNKWKNSKILNHFPTYLNRLDILLQDLEQKFFSFLFDISNASTDYAIGDLAILYLHIALLELNQMPHFLQALLHSFFESPYTTQPAEMKDCKLIFFLS